MKEVSDNIMYFTNNNVSEGEKVTVDLNAQGWVNGNAVKPATITLKDGTKITFEKGDGYSTPAYYESDKGVRVYAKNTITISGRVVAKVVLTCDKYAQTSYTGNDDLYANADGDIFTICNDYNEPSGGEQLRIQSIEITFAK